ncbi:archaetidylserine decarboxylase [Portibacter marinus]|uniref:archaetidylserine decarboxylase n=1 Tax=Portibacter marinus TaxID=2898660 RepID=UPI001EEAD55C|nr:archaetidylserine decarboxylase [Portibacter marinus]
MEIKFINRKTGQFEIEQPPAEKLMRFLYHHPIGKNTILPLAIKKWVSVLYGRRMDRPESVGKIKSFVDQQNIDMAESLRPAEDFTSFNDFFIRKLRGGARPIESGLVSPGDGKLLAFKRVRDVDAFYVKGQTFTLKSFLKNEALANEYKDASMLILRLAPNDYHRFHFPYDGTPSKMTEISGTYYSVSPIALTQNFGKFFTENKRSYCLLQTEHQGNILIAPVGATMVGTIHTTYVPENPVHKGDEMGYFTFGGSSILFLVTSQDFMIDQDLLDNTRNGFETAVKMGEKIGELEKVKSR